MLDFMDNNKYALLVGRVALGLIYLIGGLGWLVAFDPPVDSLADRGFPLPALLGWLGLIFKLGGAVMITIGYQTRIGALMLIVFTLMTAFGFHPFWVEGEFNTFMKEISMIGGLLILACVGPGAISLDAGRKAGGTPSSAPGGV